MKCKIHIHAILKFHVEVKDEKEFYPSFFLSVCLELQFPFTEFRALWLYMFDLNEIAIQSVNIDLP